MNSLTQVLLDIARTANQERAMEDEGYPGIAHDFTVCQRQRDDLLAALKEIAAIRVTWGYMVASALATAREIAQYAIANVEPFDKSDELDDTERFEEREPEISGQTGFSDES